MDDRFKFDVFLSHNAKDKARVRRLAKKLADAGLKVWFDETAILPGDDIYLAVERGLSEARVLVLCISKNALGSNWVALERSTVLFRDPTNADRRFVPFLLEPCEIPDTLRRYKYLDYSKESAAALNELIASCRPTAPPVALDPVPIHSATVSRRLPHRDVKKKSAKRNTSRTEERDAIAVFESRLPLIKGGIKSTALSPNGRILAVGLMNGTVRLWNFETKSFERDLTSDWGVVNFLLFRSDGNLFACYNKGAVCLWDLATEEKLSSILYPNQKETNVWCAAFLEEEQVLLTGGGVGEHLEAWQLGSGQKLWQRSHSVNAIALIGAGPRFLCADGHDIHLMDVRDGDMIKTLSGHSDQVWSLAVTPDTRHVISVSWDQTAKIWDIDSGQCIGTLEYERQSNSMLLSPLCVLSPQGDLLITLESGQSRLWDWVSGKCLQKIDHDDDNYRVAVFSLDGSRFYISSGQTMEVWRLPKVVSSSAGEKTRRYVNAKVVLIGESTVGKTTLAHRLLEDKYVKTESTHGMNVSRLDLPMPIDETIEREALLWDLAGQDDYRLIHQLFLEETALALLLINPQKDDPFLEAGDWLKALRAAVATKGEDRDVAKLLIPTRLDVGGMKISQRKIDRFVKENGFAACLPVGSKRGDNCSDRENGGTPSELKQLIANHIPWDKLPWTSTPRVLAEIKNAVIAMRDRSDIRLLRFAELAQRLEQALPEENIGSGDVRTAITLLANHGLIRPFKFGDLVLLRPDLLNGYAAAIVRAARAHRDEIGCVSEEAIYSDKLDLTGVDRLKHRPDEELLLRALVQTLLDHSLCIRETEDGQPLLIFPSQYRRDREIPTHPEILVSYTFSGELQTIYTTLVVRLWYSRTFDHKELWQNAAEFATSKGQAAGVLFDKLGDGLGKISIFFEANVPDELKVVFIEFIHRHLRKYGRDLKRERRYVCLDKNCGEPVKDMEAVARRIRAGKDFVYCTVCDRPVPFRDHIEDRLTSDPVARQVVEMDERATQELDSQALEQILIGHMHAICGEANQIFRMLDKFDYGIDGEVEFKSNLGKPSGKKIYVQLKSGNSYLRTRKTDGVEIFDVKDARHLEYWVNQPVDVYLVIRQSDSPRKDVIRWMNVTQYLRARSNKTSRQIVFEGEELTFETIWRLRDAYFPPERKQAAAR